MAIRILLADDNDQFRAVIRQFLGEEAADLQVVGEVVDGAEKVATSVGREGQ
jgi:DNA-binding NarL/FixJ family response regulator